MSLRREYDDQDHSFSDFSMEEEVEDISHKKRVRKLLEDKLERKRLKAELDELDGDFDWDDFDK